jgi:hypothetical protein
MAAGEASNDVSLVPAIATTTDPLGGPSAGWTVRTESFSTAGGVFCSPDAALTAPSVICFAKGTADDVQTSTDGGVTWTAETLAAGTGAVGAASCASDTLCVVGTALGNVAHSGNASAGGASATWSGPLQGVAGGQSPILFSPSSCPSASLCVGFDGAGRIITSSNGAASWTSTVTDPGGGVRDVECPAKGLCVGIDATKVSQSSSPAGGGSTWAAPATIDDTGANLTGLQCPTATLCVATDNAGNVLQSTNPAGGAPAWSTPVSIDSSPITRLVCPSTSLCVATDAMAQLLTSTNPAGGAATWSAPVGVSVTQLECPSASLCVGIDGGYLTVSTNPAGGAAAWSVPAQIDAFQITQLQCPSSSLCVASDGSQAGTGPARLLTCPGGVCQASDVRWGLSRPWRGVGASG